MFNHVESAGSHPHRRVEWLLAGLGIFLACGFGGGWAGLEPKVAWAAASTLLMAFLWITQPIPLWSTALLPLVLFPLLGGASLPAMIGSYFDPVNFLFLGGMLIAAGLEEWMLHRRIALGILHRLGASPQRIVLGFMVSTGFITLWISNTATALLMYPIGLAVLKRFEEQRPAGDPEIRRFGAALMLGIAYAASIGGVGTKIGTGPNMILAKEIHRSGIPDISFLTWLKVGLPIVVLVLPLVWLYLVKFAEPVSAEEFPSGRETIDRAHREQGPMQRGEWVALVAFLTAAFLWTFRQEMDLGVLVIPGWASMIPWTWSGILGGVYGALPGPIQKLLSSSGAESQVAMGIGLLLLVLPIHLRPRRFALSLRTARGISWDMLLLLGGGFAMAEGIQRSGLSQVMAGALRHLPAVHPFWIMVVLCLVTVMLSEVASNTATVSIMLPLIVPLGHALGFHPGPLMFAATLSASFGFMLPAGTPPNAVVFASGYLTVPQMARTGILVDLAGALVIAAVCCTLAPWALGVPLLIP